MIKNEDKLRELAYRQQPNLSNMSLDELKKHKRDNWRTGIGFEIGAMCLFIVTYLGKNIDDSGVKQVWGIGALQITLTGKLVRVMLNTKYVFDPHRDLFVPGKWLNIIIDNYHIAKIEYDAFKKEKEIDARRQLIDELTLP